MSIFTHAGRAALAEIVLSRPIHLALGLGEDSWGAPPPAPDYDVTTLRREIGRKKLFRGLFVHPDDHGTLILPGDRKYSISDTPTRHLYLQFLFDYNEGAGGAIRELGLFLNTKAKAEVCRSSMPGRSPKRIWWPIRAATPPPPFWPCIRLCGQG